MILGLDFGTCYSLISIMGEKKPYEENVFSNYDKDGKGFPTLFCYHEGKKIYGIRCIEAGINKRDVVAYVKRKIRENPSLINESVVSDGKKFSYREIIKGYLEYVIGIAKEVAVSNNKNDTEVEAITVTSPVGLSEGQMTSADYNKMLKDIVREILPKTKIINVMQEPVAAAISYLFNGESFDEKKLPKQNVLVFDLGGGTLDVTAYECDGNEFRQLAVGGDLTLGGLDWDKALAKYLKKQVGVTDLSEESEEEFMREVEDLKLELTVSESEKYHYEFDGVYKKLTVTRSEFEEVTRPLLDRAVAVARDVAKRAGKIDRVVLVGGSSNMPQIRNRLEKEFGATPVSLFRPSRAIADGAAISSKRLVLFPRQEDQKLKTICSYGFNFIDESDNREEKIRNIILKETTFTNGVIEVVDKSMEFYPNDNTASELSVHIYESDSGEKTLSTRQAKANGMVYKFDIPREFKGKARNFKHHVGFTISQQDGIPKVFIVDTKGNKVWGTRKDK